MFSFSISKVKSVLGIVKGGSSRLGSEFSNSLATEDIGPNTRTEKT